MRKGGLKFKDCRRILIDNGFLFKSQSGSHKKFTCGDSESIILPDASNGVNRMMWRRLCKEHGIICQH